MIKPITHSALVAMLGRIQLVQIKDIPQFMDDVAEKTRYGVIGLDNVVPTPPVEPAPITNGGLWPGLVHASGYVLSARSRKELEGVKPELRELVPVALAHCPIDFGVHDGIRTVEEQRKHVASGASKTMQSKHLTGLAVDLVPWINGKWSWDWDAIFWIAYAMDFAATQAGVAKNIRWGGAWDRTLADFGNDAKAYDAEIQAYRKRGGTFFDGPHFEWVS